MKRVSLSAVVLVLTVCALYLTSANQADARQSQVYYADDARLRMKHSPVLGINFPIAVWIDGVQAGSFTKGHVFERRLAPGRHNLYVRRPGLVSNSWSGTLNVRSGEIYNFVVKSTPSQVILVPVRGFH